MRIANVPRVAPVLETTRVSIHSTSGDKQHQDNDTNDDDDLETGKPELKLAKETDTKVVDAADGDEEDSDPDSRVDPFTGDPELNDQCRSRELVRSNDDVLAPVTIT